MLYILLYFRLQVV